MRILFLTLEDVSSHKGSSTHIREKVTALRKHGHAVTLVAGSKGTFDFGDFLSIGLIRSKDGGVSYTALTFALLRMIRHILKASSKTDLIYVREPVAAFAVVLTKPIHRRKFIFEVNSLDNEEIRMKGNSLGVRLSYHIIDTFQKSAGRHSDRILVITDRVKNYYHTKYGIPEERIDVLGVTTDPEKFYPIDEGKSLEELRNRLGIGPDDFVVSYIGNLAHWQDFDLFLKSASIVIEKNPKTRFLIIGDGSQKVFIEEAIAEKGLSQNIHLLGQAPHDQIVLYINISDICIAVCKELKSGYSPMKLFEYFACGKPVVATRVAGYEIVEKIDAGRLVDGNKAADFAFAILELTDNPKIRQECGANALDYSKEHFGWDKVVHKIEVVMEELTR